MKVCDKVFVLLKDKRLTVEEIDRVLEKHDYRPVESDDSDGSILRYTNGISQLWVYCTMNTENLYYVKNVTVSTKKRGKTTVHAFRNHEDIKRMISYFWDRGKYDEYLIFLMGLLLARRIGDTLSLRWSDFYEQNGRRKNVLNTLVEQKTNKIVDIHISDVVWKYIDKYCDVKDVNPTENISDYVFLNNNYIRTRLENIDEIVKKRSASFRYEFKKAAKELNIDGVSTHSLRKTFGYIAHNLNKYDPDCLDVLQSTFGHSDRETTKRYIDVMNEKAMKLFNDVSEYIGKIDDGEDCTIDNMSVIAFKADDFRTLITDTIKQCATGKNGMDIMNDILNNAERVSIRG